MAVTGVSATELLEIKSRHKDMNHRKRFEETKLGSLPPEILLKIMGYLVPDCKSCFLQRDLLRLGSVCKKLNHLTKVTDFYKEIKLSDECCPLPTTQALGAMLEKSGSKLKKIVCNYKCKELLSIAVLQCGDTIQEIHVEDFGKEAIPFKWRKWSCMLNDMNRLNPTLLTHIQFKNINFTFKTETNNWRFIAGQNPTLTTPQAADFVEIFHSLQFLRSFYEQGPGSYSVNIGLPRRLTVSE